MESSLKYLNNFILIIFLVLLSCVSKTPRKEDINDSKKMLFISSHCSEKIPYDHSCGNCNIEDGYNFALEIQTAVRNRDLLTLFSYVKEELHYGYLRKNFIKNKKFSDVFSEDFREKVLTIPISCYGTWRGFNIGWGEIWYNYYDDTGWTITSMPTHLVEEPAEKHPGWIVNGKTLSPSCFVTSWISSDNFEEFAKRYSIAEAKLDQDIGLYLGKEIPIEDNFTPNWSNGDEKLSLTTYLDECALKTIISKKNNLVPIVTCEKGEMQACNNENETDEYRIVQDIPKKFCSKFAPHISKQCESIKLIHKVGKTTGSMGNLHQVGIYGLFQTKTHKNIILPLKYLGSVNMARNYVDNLISEGISN